MPATRDELFARLAELGIATTTHEHPPVVTVAEARRHVGDGLLRSAGLDDAVVARQA